jgi:threonine dehydrogenase-like Zn-dependent dehydrogenase
VRALILRGPGDLATAEFPKPKPTDHEVRLRVNAVGVCGTDFHIFDGLANYNLDGDRRTIPLEIQAQILGHEFCGTVESLGARAKGWRVGQRAIVDQVRTCISDSRNPVCEFCESGDSHQCEYGQEYGITGLPGGFAEYVTVPDANLVPIPEELSSVGAALVEPLGCVLHALDRMEHAANRYWFEGRHPIRSILIIGGGPAGLLFVQCFRKICKFAGRIVVADRRPRCLELASRFGGSPVDVSKGDPAHLVLEANSGVPFECIVEATGNGRVLDWLPLVARRQTTLVLYGAGHGNLKSGCLTPWQALEFTISTSAGASGKIAPDGTPLTYARALEAIVDGRISVEEIVTHRYPDLEGLIQAFVQDSKHPEFVKGVMVS